MLLATGQFKGMPGIRHAFEVIAGSFGLVRPEWIRYIRAVPQIGGVRLNTDVTRDLLCDLHRWT